MRAIATAGESAASNETMVTVGSAGGCTTAPNAPGTLSATVSGLTIAFSWGPSPGCAATTYLLHAGNSPGASNIATLNVGNVLQFSATAPAGTYYVFVAAVNATGQSAHSNVVAVVVGSAGVPVPTPTPTPPAPTGSFGPGQWLVGSQVAPGRYFTDPTSGCYWERQRGLTGSFDDIIANEFVGFDARQWIVDIASSDLAFETDGDCGSWFNTPRHGHQGASIPPGVWMVGAQVTPGTYLVAANSGCYWERLNGFSGNSADIIDNEFAGSSGQELVTILSTDTGFHTDGDCGTWTRISDERLTSDDRQEKGLEDIELTWRADYQHRTGAEPRVLIKRYPHWQQ